MKNLNRLIIYTLIFSFGLMVSVFAQAQDEPKSSKYVPGEITIRLKEGKTLEDIKGLIEKYGLTSGENLFKEPRDPKDVLKDCKNKLADLDFQNKGWYWQLDKNSSGYKERKDELDKEKEDLKERIKAQEEFIAHQEARQKRAPVGLKQLDLSRTYVFKVDEKIDIIVLSEEIKKDPNVESSQPDYIVKIELMAFPDTLPNDTYVSKDGLKWKSGSWGQPYEDMWNLKIIEADKAWKISQGQDIIIAVIDTGVDYNHEDLSANMWTDIIERFTNRRDDDGDGYVDDFRGWNFAENNNLPMDKIGHGTHVAGIIAACGNNSKGVIGVAPRAKIMPIKFSLRAGTQAAINMFARSIYYAVKHNADIINCSWSIPLESDYNYAPLEDALYYAYTKGCVIVAAAGNDPDPLSPSADKRLPANFWGALAIASTDTNDCRSVFSSRGPRSIDVAAPGGGDSEDPRVENIISLRAAGTDMYLGTLGYKAGTNIIGNKYYRSMGTSMSAPVVSGIAALLMAKYPQEPNYEIGFIIKSTTDSCKIADDNVGTGRVNAYKALMRITRDITPPEKPEVYDEGGITNDKSSLSFFWESKDKESAIVNIVYRITRDSIDGPVIRDWTSAADLSGDVLADGLNLEDGYYYIAVKVRNYVGLWSENGYSNGIRVDASGPTNSSIIINNGNPDTNNATVSLDLYAQDNGSGVSTMKFRNDAGEWTQEEPYAKTKAWTLTPGEGMKFVDVIFKDEVGNYSAVYEDTIYLDLGTLPLFIDMFNITRQAADSYIISFHVSRPVSSILGEITKMSGGTPTLVRSFHNADSYVWDGKDEQGNFVAFDGVTFKIKITVTGASGIQATHGTYYEIGVGEV